MKNMDSLITKITGWKVIVHNPGQLKSSFQKVHNSKGEQNPKFAFRDIDFKLVIKKQKIQKEYLILPFSYLRDLDEKAYSKKKNLRMFALAD